MLRSARVKEVGPPTAHTPPEAQSRKKSADASLQASATIITAGTYTSVIPVPTTTAIPAKVEEKVKAKAKGKAVMAKPSAVTVARRATTRTVVG